MKFVLLHTHIFVECIYIFLRVYIYFVGFCYQKPAIYFSLKLMKIFIWFFFDWIINNGCFFLSTELPINGLDNILHYQDYNLLNQHSLLAILFHLYQTKGNSHYVIPFIQNSFHLLFSSSLSTRSVLDVLTTYFWPPTIDCVVS